MRIMKLLLVSMCAGALLTQRREQLFGKCLLRLIVGHSADTSKVEIDRRCQGVVG